MEWLLVLLGGGAGAAVLVRRLGRELQRRREAAAELAGVVAMADEDTTLLGEQLSHLGGQTPVGSMSEAARRDYQTALDAYESAKRAVPRLRSAEEVSQVVDTLSTGRYALSCVRADLEGRPAPELTVPCFFNPQHGPSVRDVRWAAPGRGLRVVPACAQDAARVERGEQPEIRKIRIGGLQAPYWEAGAAFLPYGQGYFASAVLESGYRAQQQGGGSQMGLGQGL
jgi:hypothetical protein